MQRVSDLLNDSRRFLPFQVSDGRIAHLQKSKIATVSQLVQEQDQEDQSCNAEQYSDEAHQQQILLQ